MQNSRPWMELHNSIHEVIGVILPEITHATLVVDDRSIDIKISSLAGMTTIATGNVLPEPRREEPDRILEPMLVLLLVRDEIHSRVDSISPLGLVHLIFRYSDNPAAKNPAVLSPMISDSRERVTNLAHTQSDIPERKIQSMSYPISAR